MVRELIQHCGIEGCGGASDGLLALEMAAKEQRVHVVAILTQAGVVDTDAALLAAARNGGEASVTFLLQHQRQLEGLRSDGVYVNHSCPETGISPLIGAMGYSSCSCGCSLTLERTVHQPFGS